MNGDNAHKDIVVELLDEAEFWDGHDMARTFRRAAYEIDELRREVRMLVFGTEDPDGPVSDGCQEWEKCGDLRCDLQVVRPGKVQCSGYCDVDE